MSASEAAQEVSCGYRLRAPRPPANIPNSQVTHLLADLHRFTSGRKAPRQ